MPHATKQPRKLVGVSRANFSDSEKSKPSVVTALQANHLLHCDDNPNTNRYIFEQVFLFQENQNN